ncbi:MAG TPA: hypothetical protein EYH03_00815 [Chromatiales bacterium]|nr:hypothetical protein [Chromatiales bacterium]
MDIYTFKNTLAQTAPSEKLSPELSALWYDAKGEWDRAHRIVQQQSGVSAAWVHAYLHRKEGDLSNADYWYSRAGRSQSAGTLEEEWEAIVQALLQA